MSNVRHDRETKEKTSTQQELIKKRKFKENQLLLMQRMKNETEWTAEARCQ